MIDIHCHILPQIDDGAWDMVESLNMARLACDSGVHTIVATPHFPGTEAAMGMLPEITKKTAKLGDTLHRAGIPVRILPGAEILYVPETLGLIRTGRIPVLAGTRYVLTEFNFDVEMGFIEEALSRFRDAGYCPVVAHPERYGAVQREPERLESWFRDGIVIQVNKGSPLGAFGTRARAASLELLEHGLVHIIASDGHSSQHRTPHMSAIRQWSEERLGSRYAEILLEENPDRLIRGMKMK